MKHLRPHTLAALGLLLVAVVLTGVGTGEVNGMDRLWPMLVGAALGFAPGAARARVAGFAIGVGAGWAAVTLRGVALPDTQESQVVTGALVLVIVAAVAAASRGGVPLWAALIGAAGYLALADHTFAVDLTGFGAERLDALGTLLLGAGLGLVAAVAVRALGTDLRGVLPRSETPSPGRAERPVPATAAITKEKS